MVQDLASLFFDCCLQLQCKSLLPFLILFGQVKHPWHQESSQTEHEH